MADHPLYLLLLHATLLTPLMARNALKSNVTWSSYPFLPPTGASGCLAELVGNARWYEGNSLGVDARRLHETPGYESSFALGAYPSRWQFSRRHFRAHLGSIFNYEAAVWSAGRNEGKKLAVVEEVLGDNITFVIAGLERSALEDLHGTTRGRLAPVAKKGSLHVGYPAQVDIIVLTPGKAKGDEEALALVPITEMGSLPQQELLPGQTLVGHVPVRSRLREGRMEWDVIPSIWEEGLRFRADVPIFVGEHGGRRVGVSQHVWDRIRTPWVP